MKPIQPQITPRELEVVELIVSGKSLKEIAHDLGISRRTVEFHVERLHRKLGVWNAAGLVREALTKGLVKV